MKMNIPNYNNSAKPIFLVSILVISIVTLGFLMPTAYAEHPPGYDDVSKFANSPLVVPGEIFSIRDINNPLDQANTTSIELTGTNVLITVEDADANLDSEGIDKVLAILNSTSDPIGIEAILEETGDDTGIFTNTTLKVHKKATSGDKLLLEDGDALTAIYEAERQGVGRAEFSFGYDPTGFTAPPPVFPNFPDGTDIVTMKDVILVDATSCKNDGFDIITHPIDLQSPDFNAKNVRVTISITNAVHGNWAALDTNFVKVLYKKPGAGSMWEDLTIDPVTGINDNSKHDITPGVHPTGTITNVFQPSTALDSAGIGDVSGEYALGYTLGCGGGGGGGLVRPGFVVNALAGAGVVASLFDKGGALTDFTGGSKNGPAKPTVTSGVVNTVSDEEIGFLQQGITSNSESGSTSNSLDSTQNVGIGQDLTFSYNVYENKGTDNLIHSTMYFFDAETMSSKARIDVSKSETYIMFNKGQPVQVVDPYGYFEKASFEMKEIDTFNSELKYDITFGKTMPQSHIVVRNWDGQKYSTDSMFPNAVIVSENSIVDNDNLPTEKEPLTQSEFDTSPFLDTQYESQIKEEETTKTGFPGIPLWVKNNAMWWHEKQIDDEDFVAGIQYMVNEEIITIPETQITSSAPAEIPSWISNVAGYWSSDEISDDEFVKAMQWLVSNGVMEV